MNVEDLDLEGTVRTGLHQAAGQIPAISNLPATAIERGRRRRALRRATVMGGTALAVAVSAGSIALAHTDGASRGVVRVSSIPPTQCPTDPPTSAGPWWDTWVGTRQDGPLDNSLIAAASRYWYGESKPPESLCIYAAGTTPDGSTWIMYAGAHAPHLMQWLQGLDGVDIDGHYEQTAEPKRTWSSFLAESVARPGALWQAHRWLIVVGRPGTTQIDYSPDGATWQAMNVHDGIGYVKIDQGFPPATARVRLSDANGVYATGTPTGTVTGEPNAGGDSSAP